MASDRRIALFRRWYALMLRLYPAGHRARFGRGMVQSFNDLLREQAAAGRSTCWLALGLFAETLRAILVARVSATMKNKAFFRPAIGTTLILLVPLVMTIVDRGRAPGDGWHWELDDFAAMGCLLFSAGVCFEVLSRRVGHALSRVALGAGISLVVLAIWAELAVQALSQLVQALTGWPPP